MLDMKVSNVCEGLVRQLLVGNGRDDEALYFNFDCRLAIYGYDEEHRASRGLHVLYHLREGSTYITVFSAVTENCFADISDVKEWEHVVTHDSCWRETKIFSDVYFGMAKEINKGLAENGHEPVAPCEMSEHVSFPLFKDAFRWVKVRVERDHLSPMNYKRVVKVNP